MTTIEITNEVVSVLREQVAFDPEKPITKDMLLEEDLGMDSLDMVEVAMTFEEKYNFNIDDDEAAKCVKVIDIIHLIDQKLNDPIADDDSETVEEEPNQEEAPASTEDDAEDTSK